MQMNVSKRLKDDGEKAAVAQEDLGGGSFDESKAARQLQHNRTASWRGTCRYLRLLCMATAGALLSVT